MAAVHIGDVIGNPRAAVRPPDLPERITHKWHGDFVWCPVIGAYRSDRGFASYVFQVRQHWGRDFCECPEEQMEMAV